MIRYMDTPNKGNFIRGTLELLILCILQSGDYYGYQLADLIKSKSNDILSIPVGTLYPLLYRMEEKGFISVEQKIIDKRLRTYYHLLESGTAYYASLLKDYEDINTGIRNILDGYETDAGKE
jgi:PadR family transcriptional regulator PadR